MLVLSVSRCHASAGSDTEVCEDGRMGVLWVCSLDLGCCGNSIIPWRDGLLFFAVWSGAHGPKEYPDPERLAQGEPSGLSPARSPACFPSANRPRRAQGIILDASLPPEGDGGPRPNVEYVYCCCDYSWNK